MTSFFTTWRNQVISVFYVFRRFRKRPGHEKGKTCTPRKTKFFYLSDWFFFLLILTSGNCWAPTRSKKQLTQLFLIGRRSRQRGVLPRRQLTPKLEATGFQFVFVSRSSWREEEVRCTWVEQPLWLYCGWSGGWLPRNFQEHFLASERISKINISSFWVRFKKF